MRSKGHGERAAAKGTGGGKAVQAGKQWGCSGGSMPWQRGEAGLGNMAGSPACPRPSSMPAMAGREGLTGEAQRTTSNVENEAHRRKGVG